jgi:holo-[acyl-carrier protein] synthase
MIVSVGVDIVELERFRQAAERWGLRFLQRLFSPEELSWCQQKARPYESLAVRFAAKEAVMKALGPQGLGFRDILVLSSPEGRPELGGTERLQQALHKRGVVRLHLSLAHHGSYGVALVVAEGRG